MQPTKPINLNVSNGFFGKMIQLKIREAFGRIFIGFRMFALGAAAQRYQKSLKPTSANSCVVWQIPLGYVDYHAPSWTSAPRLALHHYLVH